MRRFLLVPLVVALALAGVANPAAAKPKPKFTVNVTAQESAISVGDHVRIDGVVAEADGGSVKIYVKQGTSKSYKYFATTSLGPDGSFLADVTLHKSGPARIKVVRKASSTYAEGAASVGVGVFAWFPLSRVPGKKTIVGTSSWGTFTNANGTKAKKALLMRVKKGQTNVQVRFSPKKQCSLIDWRSGLNKGSHAGELGSGLWFTSAKGSSAADLVGMPVYEDTPGEFTHEFEALIDGGELPYHLWVTVQLQHTTDQWGYSNAEVFCNYTGVTVDLD